MDLLERFSHGDIDAFETVFRQFQHEVYGWIVRIVRDSATAEDLTIETFWHIYRSHARFEPTRGFGAWARRIAINLAFSHLRAAHRETGRIEEIPDPSAGPGACAEEVHGAIRLAFGALPPKLREVAVLTLIEERPYSEVAEALGITVAAARSRRLRAVRLLRKKLTRLGFEPCTMTTT
jgi:RNA polymerase sigma-70 factor, ECF subfamily